MQKHYYILFLFALLPVLLFSQKGYKSDTIIYQKQGEPYRLIPKWEINKSDTFNLSSIDLVIMDGDTIANKRLSSKIIHQVNKITDTAVFQTAKIGKEIYQQQVYYKNIIPENPRIKDFYVVEYQTDKNGENIKITNCADSQKHLIPDLEESLELLEQKNIDGIYLFRDYPNKMKDCQIVQSFLTNDLTMFHQLFNQLVPLKDTLKYQIRMTDTSDTKSEVSMYLQIKMTSKENGNTVFELSEDKTRGATVLENLTTELADILNRTGDNFGVDDDENELKDEDKTIIEVDKFNFPVKIFRRNFSSRKPKEGISLDLYEYKIEKVRH